MNHLSLMDRPIAFQRSFIRLGVGITGALMLSQAVYWSVRTKSPGQWFYKTQQDWEEETGLTRREQETARRRLVNRGFIEEQKRGIPCRLYYRVNTEALEAALMQIAQACMSESDSQEGPVRSALEGETRQAISETTQENTTEREGKKNPLDQRPAGSTPTRLGKQGNVSLTDKPLHGKDYSTGATADAKIPPYLQ